MGEADGDGAGVEVDEEEAQMAQIFDATEETEDSEGI